jgi:hypothetical protein
MSLRLPLALAAVAIGAVGLTLNAYEIAGVMGPPQNRSFPDFFVYYWTFLTNLSNGVLLLIYAAELSGVKWLGWFREPVTKAGMAGIMMLVMFFYHFMLAPTLPDLSPLLDFSNVLLHYLTPLMFLAWWAFFTPHGTLRYRDLPMMLVPGLAYVAYVQVRGPLAGEYPYTILDPGFAPPGGQPVGFLGVAIGVGVLVVLVSLFDLCLVFVDGVVARRRTRGRHAAVS